MDATPLSLTSALSSWTFGFSYVKFFFDKKWEGDDLNHWEVHQLTHFLSEKLGMGLLPHSLYKAMIYTSEWLMENSGQLFTLSTGYLFGTTLGCTLLCDYNSIYYYYF